MIQAVRLLIAAMVVLVALPEEGQAQLRPSRESRTTARQSDYKTGYNLGKRRPRNYDQHYYAARTGYQLSPYLVVPNSASRPVVPVEPYTSLQYGTLITSSLDAHPVAASSVRSDPDASILKAPRNSAGFVQTQVVGVLDRGALMLETGEQVRLRGVRVLSSSGRDETTRLFGREAMQRLQGLTAGKEVYMLLDEPVRDRDGMILVTAFLPDGTELNRLLLEEGLAQLQNSDFAGDVNFEPLIVAEQTARSNKTGVWSRY